MKSIDFSKGVRGKFAQTALKVVGESEETPKEVNYWAICVHHHKKLVERKVYYIVFEYKTKQVSVVDETGDEAVYPSNWFLPVKLDDKSAAVLEQLT